MPQILTLFWFRRDLRLNDNAGLYHALKSGMPVLPVFIFDTDILDSLTSKTDKRVQFIHDALVAIQAELKKMGSSLYVLHGRPLDCFRQLATEFNINAVYTNHDYEPYALKRDNEIKALLIEKGIGFFSFKDQVVFEKDEVVKEDRAPYTVFTPYSRKWREHLNNTHLAEYASELHAQHFFQMTVRPIPSLLEIGFNEAPPGDLPATLNEEIARHYDLTRNYPAQNGTTRMSVHLRFGTVGIRGMAIRALELNATLLNELIWRDFYQMILWHFPYVVNGSFKKEYDHIQWRNNKQEFEKWCNGQTGYPIVDAGMRQLNQTGFMHNRVRMIVASFLTKHLLIDWRWGEAYFAEKLLDYDLAANNGGWQWAAGCGCDAAPYFRIFNPYLQTQKFDPELRYIKQWVPEYEQLTYPHPIVDHSAARERCLRVYKAGLGK